jgi:hypothetical protein
MKLYPKEGKLQEKNGKFFALILEAEPDPFHCEFEDDDSDLIKTEGHKWITLDLYALELLKNLIIQAKTRRREK